MDTVAGAAVTRAAARESSDAMERLGTLLQCDVDDTIYQCNEPAHYWYRVVTGGARKCALTADGRRQIIDFLLPGDLFGFGVRDTHRFSTEVIMPGTTIVRYPRNSAEQLAACDPQVSRWIRELAFESIARLQTRMLILGRTSALARVSAFLLEWMNRCCAAPATCITLPMPRRDIADYLALAVESVSRAFTVLRERQVIALRGTRRLKICDRHALELFTEPPRERASVNRRARCDDPRGATKTQQI